MSVLLFVLGLSGPVHALPPADRLARETAVAYLAPGGAAPTEPWWSGFQDPALSALIDRALTDNLALDAAWHRVDQARAGSYTQAGALLPTANLSTGWARNSTDAMVQQTVNNLSGSTPLSDDELQEQVEDNFGESYDTRNWRLQGAWTLDVFGVTTTTWLASRWDRKAAEGSRSARAIAVASAVGGAWFDLVAARERLEFVQEQVRISHELEEIVRLRFEGGQTSALDVFQQQQQVATIEAALPAARAAFDRTGYRLASLLGVSPVAFAPDSLALPATLPAPPPAPGLGRPGDLVDRRPDLAAAVASAEAADLRRLSAWLGLAPTLQLSGYTGEQGQILGADETDWSDVTAWQYGLTATVPLFNGGRKFTAARAQAAGARAAMSDLQQSTIDAVREVEDANRVLQQRGEELVARTAQVEAARRAFNESRNRYLQGLDAYVNVMTALNIQQSAELALIQSRRDVLTAHINLNDALGAPWARSLERTASSAAGDR